MKKIFILTGEPSGDKLASKVIKELKKGEPLGEKLDLDMLRPHQKSMLATLFNQFGKRRGYTLSLIHI